MAVQQRVSQVSSNQAPTGGINDLDPIAAMEPQYCIDLENFYPNTGSLAARAGFKEYATNIPGGKVKTLITYAAVDGSEQFFACTDDGIYDISDSTDLPNEVASLSYGAVEWCHFSNIAGNFLVVTNGVDSALLYDGTDWTQFVEADTPVAPGEIKGVAPSQLTGVTAFKNRLWFVQQDSLTAWYLPLDAVAGEAKPFYLGGNLPRGGYLVEIQSWSLDSGAGMDDKLCFFTSRGELVIYGGTDPSTAETWELESMFYISSPIGTSPSAELGGDLILLTRNGIIPLSSVVKGDANMALSNAALSKRISRTLNRIVNSQTFVPDWEIFNLPLLQALIVLIPATANLEARQYVMNALTGAWTRFNLPARCAGIYKARFYFGTDDGRVCLYGETRKDNVLLDGSGGEDVVCSMFSAYNYFGDPTSNKHYKLVRPIFQAPTPPGYKLQLNVDYDVRTLAGNPPAAGPAGLEYFWDNPASLWDNAFWASAGTVYFPWTGVTGLGFCAALLLKVVATEATTLAAVETVFEVGNAI